MGEAAVLLGLKEQAEKLGKKKDQTWRMDPNSADDPELWGGTMQSLGTDFGRGKGLAITGRKTCTGPTCHCGAEEPLLGWGC